MLQFFPGQPRDAERGAGLCARRTGRKALAALEKLAVPVVRVRRTGAVLEISIDGGAFADIIDAGGSFVTGGYGNTISDATDSPIGGRPAWTGDRLRSSSHTSSAEDAFHSTPIRLAKSRRM